MELVRFAATNNTGAAQLVPYVIPATSPLRRMFEGGGVPRFRLTSCYVNVIRGGVTRALPKPNLALTFSYSGDQVIYYDADATGPLNNIVAGTEWNLYFNSDQSEWIVMPTGQVAGIQALWIPPYEYTFAAGDDLYFFATLQVDQIQDDPFKNFSKP